MSEISTSFIVISAILTTIVVGTFVGNLFVITAILIDKNLQTTANQLVLSLAVADLMVACLVMPLGAYNDLYQGWYLAKEVCEFWTSADVLCCTASILNLLAIALDRYWAVTNVDYIYRRTRRRVNTMILCVWTVGAIVSLAPIFGWKDPDFADRVLVEHKCMVSQDVAYQLFATILTFYAPLVLLLALYWRIFQVARKRIRRKPGRPIAQQGANNAIEPANGKLISGAPGPNQGGGGARQGGETKLASSNKAKRGESRSLVSSRQQPIGNPLDSVEVGPPQAPPMATNTKSNYAANFQTAPESAELIHGTGATSDCGAQKWFSLQSSERTIESTTRYNDKRMDDVESHRPEVAGAKLHKADPGAQQQRRQSDQSRSSRQFGGANRLFSVAQAILLEQQKLTYQADSRPMEPNDDDEERLNLCTDHLRCRSTSPASCASKNAAPRSCDSSRASSSSGSGAATSYSSGSSYMAGASGNVAGGTAICARGTMASAEIDPKDAGGAPTNSDTELGGRQQPEAPTNTKESSGMTTLEPSNGFGGYNNNDRHQDEQKCHSEQPISGPQARGGSQRNRLLSKTTTTTAHLCIHAVSGQNQSPGRRTCASDGGKQPATPAEDSPALDCTMNLARSSSMEREAEKMNDNDDNNEANQHVNLTQQHGKQVPLLADPPRLSSGVGPATQPGASSSGSSRQPDRTISFVPVEVVAPKHRGDLQFGGSDLSTKRANTNGHRSSAPSFKPSTGCCCCCSRDTCNSMQVGQVICKDLLCAQCPECDRDSSGRAQFNHLIGGNDTDRRQISGTENRDKRPHSCDKVPGGSMMSQNDDDYSENSGLAADGCLGLSGTMKRDGDKNNNILQLKCCLQQSPKNDHDFAISASSSSSSDHLDCEVHGTLVATSVPKVSSEFAAELYDDDIDLNWDLNEGQEEEEDQSLASLSAAFPPPIELITSRASSTRVTQHNERQPRTIPIKLTSGSPGGVWHQGDAFQSLEADVLLDTQHLLQLQLQQLNCHNTSKDASPGLGWLGFSGCHTGAPSLEPPNGVGLQPLETSTTSNSTPSTSSPPPPALTPAGEGCKVWPARSEATPSDIGEVQEPVGVTGRGQDPIQGRRAESSSTATCVLIRNPPESRIVGFKQQPSDHNQLHHRYAHQHNNISSRSLDLKRKFRALGQLVSFVQISRNFYSSSSAAETSQSGNDGEVDSNSDSEGGQQVEVSGESNTATLGDRLADRKEKHSGECSGRFTELLSDLESSGAGLKEDLQARGKRPSRQSLVVSGGAAHCELLKDERQQQRISLEEHPDNPKPIELRHQNNHHPHHQHHQSHRQVTLAHSQKASSGAMMNAPRSGGGGGSGARRRANLDIKREKKAAKTLAIITGVFVCCWLPFFLNAIIMPICGPSCTPSDLILSILLWLGYLNSLLNPIIYTIFSPDFRLAFRRLLCWPPMAASAAR